MLELFEEVLSQLRIIWRHKWYAAGIAWVIALVGWGYVYLKPDRYIAETRVFVDTQSVLKPLMTGLAVQPDPNEMIKVMSQTLISRPNLEKVIQMAKLEGGGARSEGAEQLVRQLAKNLSIAGAGRENLYLISFVDKDPKVAKRVVESLLQLFVEQSIGDNREDADAARKFIDEQLERYRARLTASEDAIMAFKRKHLGLLPGEGPSYYTRLVETQQSLREAELALKEAENSAESIRAQLVVAAQNPPLSDDRIVIQAAEPETQLDARIRALEKKLDELRLSYTEKHPDIVAIIPMIAQLKERRSEEERQLKEQKASESRLQEELPNASRVRNPVYQELTVALTNAEAQVATLRTRVNEYRKRYAELQAVASAVPKVEAEYTQLTRDYEVNKVRYDELLKRRESAQISGDLEESGAVMGFRVVDPPRLPLVPIGPSRVKLVTLVLLLAFGGGGGGAWLIGQIRPTINDERGLKEAADLPVLGTVVMSWTPLQKRKRLWSAAGFLTSFASLLSAYVAIMAALILTASRV